MLLAIELPYARRSVSQNPMCYTFFLPFCWSACVYMYIHVNILFFICRGPQDRLADTANCVTLFKYCLNKKKKKQMLTWALSMTLRVRCKVLLHVWTYDFYDTTLSTE